METCIECGSEDLDALEIADYDCCTVMECGECGAQYERAEMVGEDHDHADPLE